MKKVAELIRFYSLDEIMEFIDEGGEYPLHHVWCYDKIKESGIQVEGIDFDSKSRLNKIGEILKFRNLQQQINLLKRTKEFDLIYAPFISDVFLLAILKIVGLYKKPILGLALDSHVPFKKNYLKRLREKFSRYIYANGIDSILFFSEKLYDVSNEYGRLGKTRSFTEWGVDLDFFSSYTERQAKPPSMDFIYSTGGTQRDFVTLVEAFRDIDFNLKITTKRDEGLKNMSPNIIIDNSIKPGLHSVGLIREEYYNSLAVAISLQNTGQRWPVGITVIMEALAMAKPIISTVNPCYPFDLEKEKIGLYVGYNDIEGWRQAVNYLVEHPDEAKEMGQRGRYLCEKKYNYKFFSDEVIYQIKKFGFDKMEIRNKKDKVPMTA